MSPNRQIISFCIPWAGGLLAGYGDLSPIGIGWICFVALMASLAYGRVVRSTPVNGNGR